LVTRPSAKVVCTAPTKRQLKDLLWAEVALWARRAIEPVRALLEIQNELITVQGRKDWFARAVAINTQSTPEEQAEALAGYHAKHLLCIIDEASGVPDPVFMPIEGYLTQPDNIVIMASNPTRTSGFFWSVFNDEVAGLGWVRFHWNSEESPLVDRKWIERMQAKYGRDSNTYRIRVLGEFPEFETDALIPKEWIERALYDELPEQPSFPVVWGVDVARYGADKSALVARSGPWVLSARTVQGYSVAQVVDWLVNEWAQAEQKPSAIFVDVTGGLGAGVADELRRRLPSRIVYDVNVSWEAFDKERFFRLRDELWWRVRRALELGTLKLPRSAEDLHQQLLTVRYKELPSGKLKIESKADMKKRGLPSPDIADALCLTFYLDADSVGEATTQRRRRRYVRSWKVA